MRRVMKSRQPAKGFLRYRAENRSQRRRRRWIPEEEEGKEEEDGDDESGWR